MFSQSKFNQCSYVFTSMVWACSLYTCCSHLCIQQPCLSQPTCSNLFLLGPISMKREKLMHHYLDLISFRGGWQSEISCYGWDLTGHLVGWILKLQCPSVCVCVSKQDLTMPTSTNITHLDQTVLIRDLSTGKADLPFQNKIGRSAYQPLHI